MIRGIQSVVLMLIISLSINAQQKFYVDLNNRADDLFKVTITPSGLTESNKIFQFASTAPGTYQRMDVGRFVRSFIAYDATGEIIETKQISTNQWEIDNPVEVKKIIYTIAETWDTKVDKDPIYGMCGTSLENDHAVINGQAVFGFFQGKQKDSIEIKLDYPSDWVIGTALRKNANGFYSAKDYDMIVDSPIMLGTLTHASMQIEDTNVDVYSYSKTGKITADNMMMLIEDILGATSQFTEGLPVNNYTFLYHFENMSYGAWEHNYSSFYVFQEMELSEYIVSELKSVTAHEFYHIITPLNIHSELVGNFNFEKPTMSQHLWLYEGITEWAAGILQLRDYLISLEEYLKIIKGKLSRNDGYDQKLSLRDLAIDCINKPDQYPNIYQKGALIGCLLDIRLLELSNGTKGLREVINQLYKDYGVNKAFSEKDFFDEFVKRTYPGIGDFINRYIKQAEKLPVQEYFAKLGIEYKEKVGVDSSKISLGAAIGLKDGKLAIISVENPVEGGIRTGDIIAKVNGEDVVLETAQTKFAFISKLKVGESFMLTVDRDGELKDIKVTMRPRPIKHEFKVLEDATPVQLELRSAWMKNL